MDKQPLVCICIPNYNNENTIRETLDSIINQTYKNIVIKIFDNASTDGSISILREYEKSYSNIQVFQNETNIGGEANFTKCIENMEGEYSAIYHADDVYMPTIVEEEVGFLLDNKNCTAVSTHAIFINENSCVIGEHFIPQEIKDYPEYIFNFIKLFRTSLKYGNIITCPSVMCRTNILKNKIKSFKFDNFKTSSDFDLWLRLAKEGDFGFLNKGLIKYRMSPASYSYQHHRMQINLYDMFLVFEKYLQDDNIKVDMTEEDYLNYVYIFNKASLSININRYLLNSNIGWLKYKKFSSIKKKRDLFLLMIIAVFNILKYIPLPSKIKNFILNLKINWNYKNVPN